MPSTPQPPWDDYDETTEDDLEARLDERVDAALDDGDPTTPDEARTLAGDIADREEAKRTAGAADYHSRLHAEANRIREADVGSWRPK
jgi:hypothetical protein